MGEEQRPWRVDAATLIKIAIASLLALPLLAAVGVTASRVQSTARFVTWPVVGFATLASAVALLGLWIGLERPWILAAGVLPALVVSYVLPAAPLVAVTAVLVVLGVLAVAVRGIAAGIAMTVGAVMVLAVVLQGPAVECGESSVSSGTGPWWIRSSTHSSSSSTSRPGGEVSGRMQVGEHQYAYRCDGARLTRFQRV